MRDEKGGFFGQRFESELDAVIQTAERERIEVVTKDICAQIEDLMSTMRSIINGELETLQQGEIDAMLSTSPTPVLAEPSTPKEMETAVVAESELNALDQSSIDSLFD